MPTHAPHPDFPYHIHVYFDEDARARATALREDIARLADRDGELPILFVGALAPGPVGPHPLPQFEVHLPLRSVQRVLMLVERTGLRALVHPLTENDLDDHTAHATWINGAVSLNVSVLDPPGCNQAIARYGRSDF